MALRNIARGGRRSSAIALLVALSIALMTMGDAVLDGTDQGVRNSYIESFTGDLAVSEASRETFSVFGSQTPVISSLARMPTITSFDHVSSIVSGTGGVAAATPIVCGIVILEAGEYRKPVSAFGVDGGSYFGLFPGLRVKAGLALSSGARGVMITAARQAEIETANKKPLSIGDPVTLGFYTSSDFQLREVPLAGIAAYPVKNEALDSIVLVDAVTLRSLLGMSMDSSGEAAGGQGATSASIDSLFSGASDIKADPAQGLKLSDVEALLRADGTTQAEGAGNASAWNYLLMRLEPGRDARQVVAALGAAFAAQGLPVAVRDWRATAGSSALYVHWLRIIFKFCILIVLAAGSIIIVNALVIAVFERTGEIGTMRALGATRSFVRRLFVMETMVLVLGSALAGIAIGALACAAVSREGLPIANQVAATLFGSTRLRPLVTPASAAENLAVAACIAAVVWVYPVQLALRIQPVRAISAE